MKRIAILVALLLSLPLVGEAQIGVNLLKNPGIEQFPADPSRPTRDPDLEPEEWNELDQEEKDEILDRLYASMLSVVRPLNFYIPRNSILNYTRTKDAHTGTYAISIYPNGESIIPHALSDYLPIQAGGTYEFSYWYKGDFPEDAILLSVSWYKGQGTGSVRTPDVPVSQQRVVKSPTEWKQKVVRFTAPDEVNYATLRIYLQAKANSEAILMDDLSFSLKEVKQQESSEKISDFTSTSEQRELFLHWRAIQGATFSILVNDRVVGTTKENSYVVEGLDPQRSYTIELRGTKDGLAITPLKRTIQTSGLSVALDNPNRIPYLYSIREPYRGVAYAARRLPLRFRELGTSNAQITYWIDGVQAQPEGNVLVFPSTGKHRLKVKIVESPSRSWVQYYKLDIE